jgi:hypothetical protein
VRIALTFTLGLLINIFWNVIFYGHMNLLDIYTPPETFAIAPALIWSGVTGIVGILVGGSILLLTKSVVLAAASSFFFRLTLVPMFAVGVLLFLFEDPLCPWSKLSSSCMRSTEMSTAAIFSSVAAFLLTLALCLACNRVWIRCQQRPAP